MSEKVLCTFGSLTVTAKGRGAITYLYLAGPKGSKIIEEPHEALALADKIWPSPKAQAESNLAIFGVGLVPPTAAHHFACVLTEWARSATERREALGAPGLSLGTPEAPRTGVEDAWLVWCDRDAGWWRPNGKGYTNNLLHAGIYTEAEAAKIAEGRPFDIAKKLTDRLAPQGDVEGTVAELLGILGPQERLFNGGSL